MATGKHSEEAPPAVQKTYEFVLWLVKKVENFPRSYRFTVGDRLTTAGLDLLTSLVEKDLHRLSIDSYGFSAGNLDEIGRMVGGWRKASVPSPA